MRIQEEFLHEQIIKKSQFLTYLKQTRTEQEARDFIDFVRHKHPDSTHVCTAYSLQNGTIQRSSDNGEPAGTAGVPMLEAIKKSDIQDITACVVRYFGGIKLGAGGLIRAYSSSVSQAIELAPKTIDVPVDIYRLSYPYSMQGSLETWLRKNGEIQEILYGEAIEILYATSIQGFMESVRDITHGEVIPVFLRQNLIETVVQEDTQ